MFFVVDVLSDIKRISKTTTEIQISSVIEIQIGTRLHTALCPFSRKLCTTTFSYDPKVSCREYDFLIFYLTLFNILIILMGKN